MEKDDRARVERGANVVEKKGGGLATFLFTTCSNPDSAHIPIKSKKLTH